MNNIKMASVFGIITKTSAFLDTLDVIFSSFSTKIVMLFIFRVNKMLSKQFLMEFFFFKNGNLNLYVYSGDNCRISSLKNDKTNQVEKAEKEKTKMTKSVLKTKKRNWEMFSIRRVL